MDDLDHSMCIAEYDWTSFYEESEECVLLQPSLACPDSSNLSDSDDSGNSSSGQRLQISENRDPGKSRAAGCCMEGENYKCCVKNTSQQINHSCSGEQDITTKAEMLFDHGERTSINTAEHITEQSDDNITTALQTEQLNVQSDGELSERKIEDRNVQMQSDIHDFISTQKCGPLSELDVNELQSTDRVASEDASGVALRAEKERWFVTVNDSPAQEKLRPAAVKKKRRQKKTCKDNHVSRSGEERSLKHGLKLEITRGNNDSDEVTVTDNVNQANYILMKKPRGCQSTEEDAKSIQRQVTSDSSQMSGEEDNLSEKLVTSQIPIDDTTETTTDSASHDTLPLNTLDSAESDELDDAVEFFSIHSFDSESYLSAAESLEELQHLWVEHQQLQSSLTASSLKMTCEDDEAGDIQDGGAHSCDGDLFGNSAKSEGHESTTIQPTVTFPSALTRSQSFNKTPGDCNTACDNDKQSFLPLDSGDHLLHVPDLTVTPVADSPETYGEATGSARPVFAISAFWDEMEKLTINDILQLRMGRSSAPRETQEATPNIDDGSSLVDTVDSILSDSSQMDTSDTADSGYFTQPDESRPDHSSCEFSTSDFEEEYRQCFGTSRNPSPDPQSEKQSVSLILAHNEESTSAEEKETLVPSENFARKCFEDQDSSSFISSKLAWPRRITKSKSVQNIQALNTEDLSLQFLFGDSNISPCLEESMILQATLMPSPFVDEQLQISFPDMFHYFFREDKANSDSLRVAVCEPVDTSLVPGFDYTLCTFMEEISLPFLHDSQRSQGKPIPIFSCSHPTVRELTFPNPEYVFLSADCEEDIDISPVRVLSHSFIQSSGRGAAASHGLPSWNNLMRKIHFPDKGSIWCRRSGAWMFPCENITIKSVDPLFDGTTATTERRDSATECFRELAVQQGLLGTIQTTRREGICSTLKQSDMCLVCIAFASWVLKSSDPEAADAWKAVLLANVSALSAIQYLRHYVKKNPS